MLALVASPSFKSAFDFEFLRETRAAEAGKIARLIASLHSTLVDPAAAPSAAAASKRRLLGVLAQAKGIGLHFMIVPPLAELRAPRPGKPHADSLGAESICATRKTTAPSRQPSMRFPKKARKFIPEFPRQNPPRVRPARTFTSHRARA